MTPVKPAPDLTEFRLSDGVRLLDRHGDLPSGAVGRIIGSFARPVPAYVVNFERQEFGVLEVRPDEIVLADVRPRL
jgi:hypothetical protein